MKETGSVLALCDTEEEYARLMAEFLKSHKDLPWELHTYTDVEELFLREQHQPVAMLVVAESAYTEEMKKLQPDRLVVLSESGILRWKELHYVDKYQQAEEVLRNLLSVYMEIAKFQYPRLKKGGSTVFIGNYSPVRRSMQTSFALTMSQLLAQEHRTLYLNFEHYAGVAELLPDVQTLDLADLLYFVNADKDKFSLRLKSMLRQKGKLDYIPPVKAGQNLLSVTAAEWQNLLQKIEETGEYEYVILDLSESMQGLFDILRLCSHIYTMTREDRVSQSKLLQYEQMLSLYEYEDLLEKTKRLNLSHIRRLPGELEQYTRGELADMVKELLKSL